MKTLPIIAAILMGSGAMAQAQSATPPSSASSRLAENRARTIDRGELGRRLTAVNKLIEQSSAAKQIDASGDPKARAKREEARELHRAARAAFEAGDLARATQKLSQASTLMVDAVHFAAPEQVTAAKKQADFNTRLASVNALLTAYKRIVAEKSNVPGAAESRRVIETGLAEANRLAAAGNYAQGRVVLDRAYLVAKVAIGSVRGGDTLVRSLKFASKQEEYRYEIDRNDTHRMLIQLLLAEKRDNANLDKMVAGFLGQARELRTRAESAAAAGDFKSAISLLEQSTAQLVRAIRNAGIYIPG